MLLESTHYFFYHIILNTVTRIFNSFSASKISDHQLPKGPKPHPSIPVGDASLRRDEVEMLMADLGVCFCRDEGEKIPEVLNCGYVYEVFEAEEPRLDEVKAAFDVFDENKDGFIDARELQRVVCVMGLKEGVEIEDCSNMIGVFDENGNGRIDFKEFVKFMENTFFS